MHAVRTYLAQRETAAIRFDADTFRALAEAREAVRTDDVVSGTAAAGALVKGRLAS